MSIRNVVYALNNERSDADEYPYLPDMKFKDFSFICTDGIVKAHKCILWSTCSIFKEDCDSMVVDFDMETTQLAVDLFYGRNPWIIDNINAYLLINLLNPSPNNLSRIIHCNPMYWKGVLDKRDEYEKVGISMKAIVATMVGCELNRWGKSREEISEHIPQEISSKVIAILNTTVLTE